MTKWEKVDLGSVCEVVRGGSPRPIIDYITEEENGVNWLKIGDVKETDKYFSHAAERIKPSGIPKTREVKRGDLILSNSMSFGRAFITLIDGYIHDGWLRLRVDENKLDKEYLYYFLTSSLAQNQFKAVATGSVVNNLKSDTVKAIQIALPSLNEQKKIAYVLNMFDEKIKINEEINDNLLQQAQAIYIHIFGDNPSVTAATIADIALNVTDGVHNTVKDDPEGQYLLLSCKNIKGGLLSIGSSERKINSETFEKLRRRTKLAKGDILISSVGTVGELLLLNTDPSNYEFQRSVAIVKPNPELVSSAYVYEYLVAKKAELINAAHGAVQQCLFISDIAGFPIGIPNPAELRSFDEVVKPMFDTITANASENLRLEALRDILLPKLMSGELDVSEVDI